MKELLVRQSPFLILAEKEQGERGRKSFTLLYFVTILKSGIFGEHENLPVSQKFSHHYEQVTMLTALFLTKYSENIYFLTSFDSIQAVLASLVL